MDIAQLKYFYIASNSLNYTTAAKNAYTSRQNLTRAIHSLEKELDTTFFIQQGNELRLTVDGERAASQAKKILDELSKLETMFAEACSPYKLKIAISLGVTLLFTRLSITRFQDFDLSVSEHLAKTCLQMACDGSVDVALIASMKQDFFPCGSELLVHEPVFALCSHSSSLAHQKAVTMRELNEHDLVLLPTSKFIYGKFIEDYERLGPARGCVREVASETLMKAELKNHDAIALVSQDYATNISQDLVSLPLQNKQASWCLYALYGKAKPLPNDARRMIDRAYDIYHMNK